jgi:L-aminopeptidase/D-esterase-like protein
VGAIVAVNSFGDVYDHRTGKLLAGAYDRDAGKLVNTFEVMKDMGRAQGFPGGNTTIGVIATNGILTKAQANKAAQMGQNGLARSINPIHTMFDGDTVFALSTGRVEADVNLVGTLGAEVMSMAISNAVINAERYNDIPACRDIKGYMG